MPVPLLSSTNRVPLTGPHPCAGGSTAGRLRATTCLPQLAYFAKRDGVCQGPPACQTHTHGIPWYTSRTYIHGILLCTIHTYTHGHGHHHPSYHTHAHTDTLPGPDKPTVTTHYLLWGSLGSLGSRGSLGTTCLPASPPPQKKPTAPLADNKRPLPYSRPAPPTTAPDSSSSLCILSPREPGIADEQEKA